MSGATLLVDGDIQITAGTGGGGTVGGSGGGFGTGSGSSGGQAGIGSLAWTLNGIGLTGYGPAGSTVITSVLETGSSNPQKREVPSVTITLTVSGGVPPYTYVWTYVAGSTGSIPISQGQPSTGFSLFTSQGIYASRWVCVITDSASNTVTTGTFGVSFTVTARNAPVRNRGFPQATTTIPAGEVLGEL